MCCDVGDGRHRPVFVSKGTQISSHESQLCKLFCVLALTSQPSIASTHVLQHTAHDTTQVKRLTCSSCVSCLAPRSQGRCLRLKRGRCRSGRPCCKKAIKQLFVGVTLMTDTLRLKRGLCHSERPEGREGMNLCVCVCCHGSCCTFLILLIALHSCRPGSTPCSLLSPQDLLTSHGSLLSHSLQSLLISLTLTSKSAHFPLLIPLSLTSTSAGSP